MQKLVVGAGEELLTIGGIEAESIVDGPGFRYTVFVQGCDFRCPGCHNPALQSFSGGRRVSIAEITAAVRANPLLSGLTLSGGDPFTQAVPCAALAEQVRALGLTVVVYTGYLWEDLLAADKPGWRRLIEAADILVDGPFIQTQKNIELRFRGSANQRLIKVPQSLAAGRVITLEEE
ncbi:MAG: radical SAM protein [Spirochaetaceae bacterium]|jgi:anaerobic ribonucleoside-triphosphate reductase activating protein|nr:radical SAM protein [Spirochaetaceae bacterium]